MDTQTNKKFDYNIVILILCFMSVLFGLGLWGTKSYFIKPISDALNITRAAYSLVDTMRYLFSATVSIFFGYLVSKFPTKLLLLIGFFSMALRALIFSFSNNIYLFYLGGAFLGIGVGLSSTTMVGYIVGLSCSKNRGTIMGLVLAANGIGSAIAIQIVSPLINASTFGYRNAYQVMACIFVAMFILLLIFYREPHKPEGYTHKKKKARGTGWIGIDYKTANKKVYFYGACVCIFFTGLCLQGIGTCKVPHMTDVGLDANFIANVGTMSSLLLCLSKFSSGFMYDRFGLRITITIDCICAVIFMTMLFLITNSTLGMVLCVLLTIFYAIALPLETVMLPIYANDLFGDKSYAKILGIFSALNQLGYALGSVVVNGLFDMFKTYKVALVVCGIVMVCIVIGLQFIISSANKVKKQVLLDNSNN